MFETDPNFDFDNDEFPSTPVGNLFQIHGNTSDRKDIPKKRTISLEEQQFLVKMKDRKLHNLQKPNQNEPKSVVQRKFPGPAGLFSNRTGAAINNNDLDEYESENNLNDEMDNILCSQTTADVFNNSSWSQMQSEYINKAHIMVKYNIDWIKREANGKYLLGRKVPFLAAIVISIETFTAKKRSPTITLKDPTGEIKGVVHHDMYEEYFDKIKVGSVLVLRNVSALIIGHGGNIYLTITLNNLVNIYSTKTDQTQIQFDGNLGVCQGNNLQNIQFHHDNILTNKDSVSYTQNIDSIASYCINGISSNQEFDEIGTDFLPLDDASSFNLNYNPAQNSTIKNCDIKSNSKKFTLNSPPIIQTQITPNQNLTQPVSTATENIFEDEFDVEFNDNFDEVLSNTPKNRFKMFEFIPKEPQIILDPNLGPYTKENDPGLVNNDYNCSKSHTKVAQSNSANVSTNKHLASASYTPNFVNSNVSKLHVATNNFPKPNISQSSNINKSIQSSQISISSDNTEHSKILQEVFDGVDAESFFEDDDFSF